MLYSHQNSWGGIKMNLDPTKFKSETVNHMVTRFTHEDCPSKGSTCFLMAMGAPYEYCEFFKSDDNKPTAECSFGEKAKEP
jgi:hypothetical protein